jgi:uncharacterized protein (DUF427 family)
LNAKITKLPGPDHPITLEPNRSRVVVRVAQAEIANSENALLLREAAWTYEHPYAAVAEIRGHLAFYRDRVDFFSA